MTRDRLCYFAPALDSAISAERVQTFKSLANETGLSVRHLARLLGVRVDSVKSWRSSIREVPEGVLNEMRACIWGWY